MPINRFIKTKPRISFAIISTLCIGVGLVVTQVQASIHNQSEIEQNNPHRIPDNLNPKLRRAIDHLDVIKREVKEDLSEKISEASETIHSLAFKNNPSVAKPTLDYTTGTSN